MMKSICLVVCVLIVSASELQYSYSSYFIYIIFIHSFKETMAEVDQRIEERQEVCVDHKGKGNCDWFTVS